MIQSHHVQLDHLSFAYPEEGESALHDVCLTLDRGEFVTLCGPSGCGKSTLLRQLKPVLAPHGVKTGSILFEGRILDTLAPEEQSARIGFVLQSPDNQIVTDKVWHELAFGLESLGYDTPTIRLRVAEMASFFGIQTWFYKEVSELSGGQKQLLNLAAVMAMQPDLLLLDEPTSQLDPIAASDFLATVGKLNRELGVTVLLTEHRLEEALPLSSRAVVMDGGRIIADGPPGEVGPALRAMGHDMFLAMPAPMRIWAGVPNPHPCPITVRDGRRWLDTYAEERTLSHVPPPPPQAPDGSAALELEGAWFRYGKDLPDVIKGLDLAIPGGSFFALVGGNGTGKTTTLSLLSGLNRPYRGAVRLDGRPIEEIPGDEKFGGLLGVLPQNPQALFVKETVERDLYEMLSDLYLSKEQKACKVRAAAALCELEPLMARHPYDLSGGEQQRAALAKVLLLEPKILLLDEPTKGLDGAFKEKLANILKRLQVAGATIVLVSHDVEFCAKYADRCALFFDGNVVTQGSPRTFFAGNSFYTTAANRMARHILPDAVTAEDVISACGGAVEDRTYDAAPHYREEKEHRPTWREQAPLPKWRKVLGGAFLALALALTVWIVKGMPLGFAGDVVPNGLVALPDSWGYALGLLAAAVAALSGAALLTRKAERPPGVLQTPREKRNLSKRTLIAAVLILLLIPLTLYLGTFYLGNRKYYFISLLIVFETIIPFFLIFEGRKPHARELVVIATLCAITVMGRAAFFFLPQFKPSSALAILAGVAFGGEAGFLVGALGMLGSNVFLGQGPWTPFQMFATGIIGFLAGVLFRKGVLRRSRAALCVYGGVTVFFLYGFIMNTYTVFQAQQNITWGMIFAACLVGVPMDLVHAVATVFFLWAAGPAMLEKLDRIKTKYGLVE